MLKRPATNAVVYSFVPLFSTYNFTPKEHYLIDIYSNLCVVHLAPTSSLSELILIKLFLLERVL